MYMFIHKTHPLSPPLVQQSVQRYPIQYVHSSPICIILHLPYQADGATPVCVCTFGTDWFNLLGFLSLLHSTLHIHLLYLRPYLHNMVMIQNSFTEYPLAIPHRSNCASHVSDLLLYHFLCLWPLIVSHLSAILFSCTPTLKMKHSIVQFHNTYTIYRTRDTILSIGCTTIAVVLFNRQNETRVG